ncbi:MAG: hypothetical protein ACPGYV_15010, partial [Phycisphaeraceae bacterium]
AESLFNGVDLTGWTVDAPALDDAPDGPQPFVVRDEERTTRADWFPEFAERQAVAKETAEAFGAVWVPFQTMFDDAVAAGTPNKHWSGDAIHVNGNGAALMAMRWLSETGLA